MTDRRSFLHTLGTALGATALGVACPGSAAVGCTTAGRASGGPTTSGPGTASESAVTSPAVVPSPEPAAIGLQLYTVRDEMRRSIADTLARVARTGYREVEFAGYFNTSPAQIRTLLDENGLRAPAAHMSLETLETGWGASVQAAHTVGHTTLVVPWLAPARRRTLDDWRRLATTLNTLGDRARRDGLRIGYHNHDFEFTPLDGSVPFDVLLAETDPALVTMELDVYWTVKSDANPVRYLTDHRGRFTMLHLKDSAGPPAHAMRDVGAGTIDFAALIARGRAAGVRHLFVEHDAPPDPFASIEASFAHLSRLGANAARFPSAKDVP